MSLDSLSQRSAALVLMLSMVFPTVFSAFKMGLLLIPLGCLLLGGGRAGRINIWLLLLALFYAFIGLMWSLYGAVLDNPGAFRTLTVMAVYPILFTLLAMVYRGNSEAFSELFLTAGLLIVVIDLSFIFGEILVPGNALSSLLKILYADAAVVDSGIGYLKFTLPNVSTMIFILSFVMCRVACGKVGIKVLIVLFGGALLVLLSGRRVVFVTAVAGPVIAYLLTVGAVNGKTVAGLKVTFFAIIILAIIAIFYSMWPDYFISRISSIFDFSDNNSNIERVLQFNALLEGIYKNPIWGNGAGAVASYIRSEEMPWAYELFYISTIFQYGFLGFFLYAVGLLFLILFLASEVRACGRATFEYYFLSGMIAFLLATATNPYIAKFDYMWVIFVPVALMNYRNVFLPRRGNSYEC